MASGFGIDLGSSIFSGPCSLVNSLLRGVLHFSTCGLSGVGNALAGVLGCVLRILARSLQILLGVLGESTSRRQTRYYRYD